MLRKIDLVELSRDCLRRALRPYPVLVRTLDGLHLATMAHMREQGEPVELASYDSRLVAAPERSAFCWQRCRPEIAVTLFSL